MALSYEFRPIELWPGEKTRTLRRSPFSANWSQTLRLLETELNHLRAKVIVIQAAVNETDIRNDGMLRASARPSWPGVILSFESKHGPLSYPCDTFCDWQSNVLAIALSLAALRTVDRYGVTRRAEQYKGWAKLPPPDEPHPTTVEHAVNLFLQVGGGDKSRIMSSYEYMVQVYRRCCTATHPDHYPEHANMFKRVQTAKQILDKHFSR